MKILITVIPWAKKPGIEKLDQTALPGLGEAQASSGKELLHLKVKVAAAPIDGKANSEVIKALAAYFGVSKSSIQILRGQTSKQKLVEVVE